MKTESADKDKEREREEHGNENAKKNENNVEPKETRLIGIIKCHKRQPRAVKLCGNVIRCRPGERKVSKRKLRD